LVFRLASLVPTGKHRRDPTSLAYVSLRVSPGGRIHSSPSVPAFAEWTIARIAALSGAESLAQAVTTWDRSRPDATGVCVSICVSSRDFPMFSDDFGEFESPSLRHILQGNSDGDSQRLTNFSPVKP
jgi:hypothetical protein